MNMDDANITRAQGVAAGMDDAQPGFVVLAVWQEGNPTPAQHLLTWIDAGNLAIELLHLATIAAVNVGVAEDTFQDTMTREAERATRAVAQAIYGIEEE